MQKKQGDRLNVGEVKSSILEFILKNEEPVGEPAIREFLLKKYNVMIRETSIGISMICRN